MTTAIVRFILFCVKDVRGGGSRKSGGKPPHSNRGSSHPGDGNGLHRGKSVALKPAKLHQDYARRIELGLSPLP